MRRLLPLFLAGLAWSLVVRAAPGPEKFTFVVVHGATAGAWEWKKAGQFLTADGHDVHRVTLTGLGEREHLNSAEINLETHINDVVNVILFEDLHDVVLTGHSYGGVVITGVMDRIPEHIRHVVFLDAFVPDDGESLWSRNGGPRPDTKIVDGLVYFPWIREGKPPPRQVPQSAKTFSQPVSYKNPAALALPVTYVAFVPKGQSAEERARTDPSWQRAVARGWTIRTFPGGHVAQQENPRGVATLMEEAVSDKNQPRPAVAK